MRLQVKVVDAGEAEAVGEHLGRGGQRGVRVAIAEGVFAQDVPCRFGDVGRCRADRRDRAARRLVEQGGRVGGERFGWSHQRGQRLVVHDDGLGGAERREFIHRDDGRDGVADVADPVGGDHRLVAQADAIERVGQVGGVLAGHDRRDTGNRQRGRGVYASDAGVGVRAAQQFAVPHAGQGYVEAVGDVAGYAVAYGGRDQGEQAVHQAASCRRRLAAMRTASRMAV